MNTNAVGNYYIRKAQSSNTAIREKWKNISFLLTLLV